MTKQTSSNKMTLLQNLRFLCDRKDIVTNDYNILIFYIFVIKTLAKSAVGALSGDIIDNLKNEIFNYCTQRYSNPAVVYIVSKLVISLFTEYERNTGDKQPLSDLLHYLDEHDLSMTKSIKEYSLYKTMNPVQKISYKKDSIKMVLDSYVHFIESRHIQYFKLNPLPNRTVFRDQPIIFSCISPVTYFGTGLYSKLGDELSCMKQTPTKEDFSIIYLEIIRSELDFWAHILRDDFSISLWNSGAVTGLYYFNLRAVEAEADRALAKGDTVRAVQLYKMFLDVSDEYRSLKGITRSYAYTSVKGKLKKLERMQSKDNSKNSNPRVS